MDRLVWAASSTFKVGPIHLGVRTDSDWLNELLQRALADYYVPDVEAPPNFSVVVPRNEHGGSTKGLNMLYEAHTNLVRSRYPERVLRALFRHLGKFLPTESAGLLRISAVAVVRDGQAILVPQRVVNWLDQLAPRLNRAGWQFVDQPWSALDLQSAELVVTPTPITFNAQLLEDLQVRESSREPAGIRPGRFQLVGWGVFSAEERVMSRAAGAAATAPSVLNPSEFGVRETITALLNLTDRFPVTGLGNPLTGDFAARVMSVGAQPAST